ncbi:MAG: DNA repair protein RadA, partial [Oscillospiraceae bacterium]|nr:DNA repair protein RadA [Oscillospiraceae bacterium]
MKTKTVFFCKECGNETGKWSGRCPACGAWNSLEEAPAAAAQNNRSAAGKTVSRRMNVPRPVTELDDEEEIRFSTGLDEMDRVLGGGAVRGSLVLVGGAPGIGKSTLLLQICGKIRDAKILYVTG